MSTKPRQPTVKKAALAKTAPKPAAADPLLTDLRQLIAEAREQVGRTVNAGLTLLYWEVGTRIRKDILQDSRAEYGARLSPQWGDDWNGSLAGDLATRTCAG